MAHGVVLGAPKVIHAEQVNQASLEQVHMDTCGFVGVAPMGPARRPKLGESQCFSLQELDNNWYSRDRTLATEITSWKQYQDLFGGFEGPGRLPYSVASFFQQGGRRAYVCRIVPDYSDPLKFEQYLARTQSLSLSLASSPAEFVAKNEGQWGNNLEMAIGFTFQPLPWINSSGDTHIHLPLDAPVIKGALLRLVNNDPGNAADNFAHYRFVENLRQIAVGSEQSQIWDVDISHDPLPASPTFVQLVECQCTIRNLANDYSESFDRLGLSPLHPAFIPAVLFNRSVLVDPVKDALSANLLPPDIDPYTTDFFPYLARQQLMTHPSQFEGGVDNYEDIQHEDFFDAGWVSGNERPGDGIQALALSKDCAMLVVPDLYHPESFEATDDNEILIPSSGSEFTPCVEYQAQDLDIEQPLLGLPGLILDPAMDFENIILLQSRALDFVRNVAGMILLMDVPPRLNSRQIMNWRERFNSRFCAAYHPWLKVNRVTPFDLLSEQVMLINPSATAAGIIASTELETSIAHGPANRLVQDVFAVDTEVPQGLHDQLHPMGINVFTRQRDGVWLTGARTLSRERDWNQISVVRLIEMLKRSLLLHMQWLVFEPNTPGLWQQVEFAVRKLLRQMYLGGAFRGETEQQGFFVRCDETLNTRQVIDAGQLITQIGVAPAHPLEFILLTLSRQADGTLTLEVR